MAGFRLPWRPHKTAPATTPSATDHPPSDPFTLGEGPSTAGSGSGLGTGAAGRRGANTSSNSASSTSQSHGETHQRHLTLGRSYEPSCPVCAPIPARARPQAVARAESLAANTVLYRLRRAIDDAEREESNRQGEWPPRKMGLIETIREKNRSSKAQANIKRLRAQYDDIVERSRVPVTPADDTLQLDHASRARTQSAPQLTSPPQSPKALFPQGSSGAPSANSTKPSQTPSARPPQPSSPQKISSHPPIESQQPTQTGQRQRPTQLNEGQQPAQNGQTQQGQGPAQPKERQVPSKPRDRQQPAPRTPTASRDVSQMPRRYSSAPSLLSNLSTTSARLRRISERPELELRETKLDEMQHARRAEAFNTEEGNPHQKQREKNWEDRNGNDSQYKNQRQRDHHHEYRDTDRRQRGLHPDSLPRSVQRVSASIPDHSPNHLTVPPISSQSVRTQQQRPLPQQDQPHWQNNEAQGGHTQGGRQKGSSQQSGRHDQERQTRQRNKLHKRQQSWYDSSSQPGWSYNDYQLSSRAPPQPPQPLQSPHLPYNYSTTPSNYSSFYPFRTHQSELNAQRIHHSVSDGGLPSYQSPPSRPTNGASYQYTQPVIPWLQRTPPTPTSTERPPFLAESSSSSRQHNYRHQSLPAHSTQSRREVKHRESTLSVSSSPGSYDYYGGAGSSNTHSSRGSAWNGIVSQFGNTYYSGAWPVPQTMPGRLPPLEDPSLRSYGSAAPAQAQQSMSSRAGYTYKTQPSGSASNYLPIHSRHARHPSTQHLAPAGGEWTYWNDTESTLHPAPGEPGSIRSVNTYGVSNSGSGLHPAHTSQGSTLTSYMSLDSRTPSNTNSQSHSTAHSQVNSQLGHNTEPQSPTTLSSASHTGSRPLVHHTRPAPLPPRPAYVFQPTPDVLAKQRGDKVKDKGRRGGLNKRGLNMERNNDSDRGSSGHEWPWKKWH